MLGQWRVVLRQAEESAKAGRFDEALALANRPDVADHRQAVLLRNRMANDLVGRAERRAKAEDLAGAIEDLSLAERFGAPPDILAAARLALSEQAANEVRIDLDSGEPARVIERCNFFVQNKIGGRALRRIKEAADSWQSAREEARRGEFGRAHEALDRAGTRLAGESARLGPGRRPGAASEGRQAAAHPKVERLYEVLASQNWTEVLSAAESVLETLPEHPAARQARTRAWQQIGAVSPTNSLPPRNPAPFVPALVIREDDPVPVRHHRRPLEVAGRTRPGGLVSPALAPVRAEAPNPKGRFLLWVDAVGGYLVCLENEILLGRAGPDSIADVPLLGDLSRNHATIVRDGDGYVLRAQHSTYVNGRKVETAAVRNGDVIRLGASVELEFQQPSPVSTTARLQIVSRHRLPLAVDGVILLAETCILGSSRHAHVPAPDLRTQVVLYRQGVGLACRAPGAFEVDGRTCVGRCAPGPCRSNVHGEGLLLQPRTPRTDGAV